MGLRVQGTGTNANTLATTIAMSGNRPLSLIQDFRVLPTSVKPWQANVLACK